MSGKRIYRIQFINDGQTYEIYARGVHQSHIYGFVEIEELIFGDKTQFVVDPSEEKLKTEFEGVKRTHVPVHAVVRVDEVDKQGVSKITKAGTATVATLPLPSRDGR